MQPLLQRMLLPFGRDLQPERWIFIVGCYNSGTTLLATMLRRHPEIAGLPTEGVYLTDALPYPEELGWPRMWCRCMDRVRLPAAGEQERARRIRRQWSLWYPRNAPNLVEKSVANAARMPFFAAHFRPAYFVYIVRNGYAAAGGIREKANLRRWRSPFRHTGYPIDLCARQWRVTDETVEADRARVQHFLSIQYEDLAARPAATMARITSFLGLPPMPDDIVRRTWNVHDARAPVTDMNDRSLERLSLDDLDRIESEAGERLRQHGYSRPLAEATEDGRPQRAWPGHPRHTFGDAGKREA